MTRGNASVRSWGSTNPSAGAATDRKCGTSGRNRPVGPSVADQSREAEESYV